MIDTDKYEETDHPELIEFEGETLGDTLTNLLAEVLRLREGIEKALIPTDTNPIIHPLTKLGDLRDALKELIK
jgi:DNA-directed RNA polymerase subunit L